MSPVVVKNTSRAYTVAKSKIDDFKNVGDPLILNKKFISGFDELVANQS